VHPLGEGVAVTHVRIDPTVSTDALATTTDREPGVNVKAQPA